MSSYCCLPCYIYWQTKANSSNCPDGSFVSAGACNLGVPGSNPGCHRGCCYAVLRSVQRHGVYSASYGTVHYKEPLKSFEIRVAHSPGFGLPSVAILPWLYRKRREAIFIYRAVTAYFRSKQVLLPVWKKEMRSLPPRSSSSRRFVRTWIVVDTEEGRGRAIDRLEVGAEDGRRWRCMVILPPKRRLRCRFVETWLPSRQVTITQCCFNVGPAS